MHYLVNLSAYVVIIWGPVYGIDLDGTGRKSTHALQSVNSFGKEWRRVK